MSEWKMPSELKAKLDVAASELGMFVQEKRDEFEEEPENWQESSKGNDVLSWIDGLDDLKTTMEDADEEPS